MPVQLLQGAARRPWLAGALVAVVASFALAGCDLSSLTGGSQCTPQTCDYFINTLVAAPGSSGTKLLADSNNVVYQYSGSTWNQVGAESFTQRGDGLIASPNFGSDNTLFLGDSESTDGGKTWAGLCVIVKAVSPNYASDKTIFAVDAKGKGGTTTGGSTTTGSGSTTTANTSCPSNTGAFYTSTDGGKTWNANAGPQGAGDPARFVVSPTFKTDKTIFATFTVNLTPNLYKSTDGGNTWNQVLSEQQQVVAVSPNYASDNTVVAVSNDKAQISTNGGQSWSDLKSPVPAAQVAEVAFSPNFASDKTLLLVTSAVDATSSTHGTFTSTDNGANWTNTGTVTQRSENFPAVVFSPNFASDKTIYASSLDQGKGPGTSTDLGKTWTAINNGLTLQAGLGG